MPTLLLIVLSAVTGAVVGVLVVGSRGAQQCRRPSSKQGRAVLQRMNISHAGVTQWGLTHVDIKPHFTILDAGCGGGQTIKTLSSKVPDGKVYGIDYSEESVAVARETNRDAIERGQVDIQLGTVSQLPFLDGTFDVVTAIETHYYWPDLPRDVRHLMQVLKPDGVLLVVAETYRGCRNDWLIRPIMQGMYRAAYLSPAEHKQWLIDAGYRDVEVFEDRERAWICVRGRH